MKDYSSKMALGRYSRVDGRRSSTSSTVIFAVFIGLCLLGVWLMTSSSIVPAQNVDETKNEVETQLKEIGATSKSNDNSDDETSSESESNTSSNMNSDTESNTSGVNTSKDSNLNSQSDTNSESKASSDSVSEISTGSEINSNESQPKKFEDNPGTLPEDATKGDNVKVSSNERNISQPEKTSDSSPDDNLEQKTAKQSRDEQANLETGPKTETENQEDTKEDVVSNTKDRESNSSEKKSKTDEQKSVDEKRYSYGGDAVDDSKATTSKSNEGNNKSEKSSAPQNKDKSKTEDTAEEKPEGIASEKKDLLPSAVQSELLNETMSEDGAWKTQAAESKKEAHKSSEPAPETGSGWKVCNVTAGPDYIPCLDNLQAIRRLRSTGHFEHKERHCPDDPPTCLVSLPKKYQRPIQWPMSREKVE